MKLGLAAWLLATVIMACGACRDAPVTPPVPGDGGAGGAPPAVLDPCERACQRLAELGCAESQPTEGGASCTEVCRNLEESGVVSLDPACVELVVQCEDVDACTSWNPP